MAEAAHSIFHFYWFPFLFFISVGEYCGAGVFGLIVCNSLSPSLALPTFFNNDDKDDDTINNNIKH